MPATAQKSPSVMKRDQLRMILFNMKKKEEYFEKEKNYLRAQNKQSSGGTFLKNENYLKIRN